MIKKYIVMILMSLFVIPQSVFAARFDRDYTNTLKEYPFLNKERQALCVSDEKGNQLLGYNETKSVVPASVSKVYVTDFVLQKMSPAYQFKTSIFISGSTLSINGDGDPFFVTEHFEDTLKRLSMDTKNMKINKVIFYNFYMNWSQSPATTKIEVERFIKKYPAFFAKNVTVLASSRPLSTIGKQYVFTSVPLVHMLRQMNIYSTNSVADILFERLGGSKAFSLYMKDTYNVSEKDVYFQTGSGLEGNTTTCTLTLSVLRHLVESLQAKGLTPLDVLPIPVVDGGSMKNRMKNISDVKALLVKPGFVYYNDTLAGIMNTSKGNVYFGVFTNYDPILNGPKARLFIDTITEKIMSQYKTRPFTFYTQPVVPTSGFTVVRVK